MLKPAAGFAERDAAETPVEELVILVAAPPALKFQATQLGGLPEQLPPAAPFTLDPPLETSVTEKPSEPNAVTPFGD